MAASRHRNVVITVNGSNDAPEVAADVSGDAGTALHAIAEQDELSPATTVHTATGSLAFRDVDLSDTHSAVSSKPAFGWHIQTAIRCLSRYLEGMLTAASALTLTLPLNDSVGTGLGSVDFSYSAVDSAFDFLAHGETLDSHLRHHRIRRT